MSERKLIFVDTETTGLDLDAHEVWDIALIEEDGTEHEFHVYPHNLHAAEPTALRITHFYERVRMAGLVERKTEQIGSYPRKYEMRQYDAFWTNLPRRAIAREVAELTANATLVGAVPDFDAGFLRKFLGAESFVPAWQYQTVDVETYAAAKIGLTDPPWGSEKITQRLRIDTTNMERHTAIGDARWARAVWLACVGSYSAGDA